MDKFKLFPAEFLYVTIDQLDLLLRKQLYQDEYINSWDRFIETSLPPKDAFYNKLRIRHDQYAHAEKLCSAFGCKTFLDYHHIEMNCMVTCLFDTFTSPSTLFTNFGRDILNQLTSSICHSQR